MHGAQSIKRIEISAVEIISFLSPNLSIYALSGKAKTTEFQSKLNSLETERKETKEPTLVLKYNQAVILFHQQQFQKSIDILNELKKKIREEPVSFIRIQIHVIFMVISATNGRL